MIRVRQIEVDIDHNTKEELIRNVAHKLHITPSEIHAIKINKKSLDARKKPHLKFIYEVDIVVDKEEKYLTKQNKDILVTPNETFTFSITGQKLMEYRPVIVGSGPAGLFCAYILAENGYQPIILERGEKVEERIKTVESFWKTGTLNANSNVQFGEGGAGTFSDGKLNTLSKDKDHLSKKVFEIFVECGANEDILYENKPHIGTDILRNVIINMRNKITSMGGTFYYNTCFTDIKIRDSKLEAIQINHKDWIKTNHVILAIGHSARDTFTMLHQHKIYMEPKPFAMGIRIQHPQEWINENQYGMKYHKELKAASYKLTYHASNGRGVYSFCMCPGGYVVNASSEEGLLAINGMSNHARDTKNANSAIVVTVHPNDFGNEPLDGLHFQRNLESLAFKQGNGKIPVQLYKDFKNNTLSTDFGEIEPVFKGNYQFANLNQILPESICTSLKEGISHFGKIIKGFDRDDAILAGIESRTSSPVRIVRNDQFESSIEGIYPIGEGAGYAGGITTAAIDGIKCAIALATVYKGIKK